MLAIIKLDIAKAISIEEDRSALTLPKVYNSGGAPTNDTSHIMQSHVNRDRLGMGTIASSDAMTSIAVDPVALITTECITVTSAMRKHARWAHSSVSAILGGSPSVVGGREISRLPGTGDRNSSTVQRKSGRVTNGTSREDDTLASRWGLRGKKGRSMQDNPLLSAFARLRNDLRGCTGQSDNTIHPWWDPDRFQISGALTSPPCCIPSCK